MRQETAQLLGTPGNDGLLDGGGRLHERGHAIGVQDQPGVARAFSCGRFAAQQMRGMAWAMCR
jgi:hypothetical protein